MIGFHSNHDKTRLKVNLALDHELLRLTRLSRLPKLARHARKARKKRSSRLTRPAMLITLSRLTSQRKFNNNKTTKITLYKLLVYAIFHC